MKKIYLMIWALALMLMAAACNIVEPLNNDDPEPQLRSEPEMHIETVGIYCETADTKVTVAKTTGDLGWSASDALAVYRSVSGFEVCPLKSTTSGGTTKYYIDVHLYGGEVRTGYALYPGTNTVTFDGSKLEIVLPDTYDISAQLDVPEDQTVVPFPMIATNESSHDLVFRQASGLLRLIVNGVPAGTTTLLVDVGKRITGKFTLTNPVPGTDAVATDNALTGSRVTYTVSADGLTAARNGVVLNVPMPKGTYTDLLVVARNSAGETLASWVEHIVDPAKTIKITRKKGYRKTFTLATTGFVTAGDGYAVGAAKYYLSPGNLANTKDSTGTWYFLGGDNGREQLMTLNHVGSAHPKDVAWDSFTWRNLYEVFTGSAYVAETDIPADKTLTIDGKEWRMPSRDEWHYFVTTSEQPAQEAGRTGSGKVGTHTHARFAKVRVDVRGTAYSAYAIQDEAGLSINHPECGTPVYVPGLMLFPDDYVDNTGSIAPSQIDAPTLRWVNSPAIPFRNFELMVAGGADFLPAAGYYSNSGSGAYAWDNVGYVGYYWSTTHAAGGETYRMAFFPQLIRVVPGSSTKFPRSVRMLYRVENANLQQYGVENF